MTSTALNPWCSILSPPSAEAGAQGTATKATSTALVLWKPQPVNWLLKTDDDRLKPFPFFELPPELRNLVYCYVLKAFRPIHSYWFRKSTNPNFAAVLQVSRLVNIEATVILYRVNTIRFISRTLRVPFQDACPITIIDIPQRFVPVLRRIAITHPRSAALSKDTLQAEWRNSMFQMINVVSQLAMVAPKIDSITYITPWYEGRASLNHPDREILCKAMVVNIAKHRCLKEIVIVYGQINEEEEDQRVHVVEPQVFPGREYVQRAINHARWNLRSTLDSGPFRATLKIPFATNGAHLAEVRRRLGMPGSGLGPQRLG